MGENRKGSSSLGVENSATDKDQADINLLLNYKKWDTVVTHNPDGEYNKYHHQQVSKMVTECFKNSKSSNAKLYYFGHYFDSKHKINAPRISDSKLRKKKEKKLKNIKETPKKFAKTTKIQYLCTNKTSTSKEKA